MEQVGWSLVDANGNEIQFWGDNPGVILSAPNVIVLPNGDQVHCQAPGPVQDCQLVPRVIVEGSPESIVFDGAQVVVTRPR